MYRARISDVRPSVARTVAVAPSASCDRHSNSWPYRTVTLGMSSATPFSSGSSVYCEINWYGSRGMEPSWHAAICTCASATDGYGSRSSGGSFIASAM